MMCSSNQVQFTQEGVQTPHQCALTHPPLHKQPGAISALSLESTNTTLAFLPNMKLLQFHSSTGIYVHRNCIDIHTEIDIS